MGIDEAYQCVSAPIGGLAAGLADFDDEADAGPLLTVDGDVDE
jgi:hypothetical protein